MSHWETQVRRRISLQRSKLTSDCEIDLTQISNSVYGMQWEILQPQSSQYYQGGHLYSINNIEFVWQKPLEKMTNTKTNYTYEHYTYGNTKNTLQRLCKFIELGGPAQFLEKFINLPKITKLGIIVELAEKIDQKLTDFNVKGEFFKLLVSTSKIAFLLEKCADHTPQ